MVQVLWCGAKVMGEVWGEFIDPKELARQLGAAMDLLVEHEKRITALEGQTTQTAIINTTPIGGYQPRNRRFNSE